MSERHYTLTDRICLNIDQFVRAVGNSPSAHRPYPGLNHADTHLTDTQKKHSARLMRINHTGEVCAQALYQAQQLVAHNELVKQKMEQAAIEENDHLAWCKTRLAELNSHTSYLNAFWYTHSFLIGLCAGMVGDAWSLGFLAETEQQVVHHLENHLTLLKEKDPKSFAILTQMQLDEAKHRDDANTLGANSLPTPVKKVMQLFAKVMVKTTYWI